MGCRLFLVRHGETAWNTQLKFQGQTDIPLSQRGIEQAELLARRLAKENFAAFFASDLKRAMDTARILAAPHELPVEPVPALREMHFGVWEGLTMEEIREMYAELALCWLDDPVQTCIPQGETLAEMAERVTTAISEIVQRFNNEEQVVVVCHGGPIRVLIATVLGMELSQYWRLRLDNACLSVIDFDTWEKGILALLNDCSHLRGVMTDC